MYNLCVIFSHKMKLTFHVQPSREQCCGKWCFHTTRSFGVCTTNTYTNNTRTIPLLLAASPLPPIPLQTVEPVGGNTVVTPIQVPVQGVTSLKIPQITCARTTMTTTTKGPAKRQ